MSAITAAPHTFGDSLTMLRRDLLHSLRYPAVTISSLAVPVVMMLLFVFVFGGAIGDGGGSNGGIRYIDYVAPAALMMTVGSASMATAINMNADIIEGIINRFRTMAIARSSVPNGHVVGGLITTLLSTMMVLGVSLAVGFRPTAGLVDWLLAFGLLG
jgi:ABC-2 type transport system permease protein